MSTDVPSQTVSLLPGVIAVIADFLFAAATQYGKRDVSMTSCTPNKIVEFTAD